MTALPNLVIAGVPKAGTTSLFNYLAQHPSVGASRAKELHYFTPLRTGQELEPLSSYTRSFAHCADSPYRMEASPSYVYSGDAVLQAVMETLPRVKVLVLLRDPTQRLWSAYTFHRSRGKLPGISNFSHFVDECEQARARGDDRHLGNVFIALSVGFYSEYLRPWMDAFGDDLRVVFFEDLTASPLQASAAVSRWLDIDTEIVDSFDFSPRNQTMPVRSTRLGHAASVGGARLRKSLPPTSRTVRTVRTLYKFANRASQSEAMSIADRERLQSMYLASNLETARMLRQRGYEQLPAWLS